MYKNPIPVVVGLICDTQNRVLIIQRKIEPHIGGWALPGGYVEEGDDWRVALQKELLQEALIEVSATPARMKLLDVASTPDTKRILIFAKVGAPGILKTRRFLSTDETLKREWLAFDQRKNIKLCFSLHQKVLDAHWKNVQQKEARESRFNHSW